MRSFTLSKAQKRVASLFVGLAATLALTAGFAGPAQAAGYVIGSTWYSNGTKSMSGPSGSQVSVYATGAVPGIPYKLVSGKNGCSTDIVPINPTIVYAGSNGIIGRVTGSINRPAGTYDVCFYRVTPGAEGSIITSPITFVVVNPLVAGSTWYSNGTKSMNGPSGSVVSAYSTGAMSNVPYQLVSGKNGCSTDIVPINPTIVYAGSNGIIGRVTGSINRPAGTYDVCFYSTAPAEGETITSPITFVVTP